MKETGFEGTPEKPGDEGDEIDALVDAVFKDEAIITRSIMEAGIPPASRIKLLAGYNIII